MPDSALNRRSEALGGWKANNASFGHQIIPRTPMRMQPTEEQLTALGNYRDIINQHLSEIAEGIGVPSQTLKGWMQDKGEPH